MYSISLIEFKEIDNSGYGSLTAIEQLKDIPFEIKRVYYITNVPPGVRRGFHAHKNLKQVLLCLNGQVKILTKTPGEEQTTVLDSPTKGLYIGDWVWREMYDFSAGAVLLVLASEHYTESDYIRSYEDYEKETLNNKTF